jgi:hypothetical protein
MAETEIPDLDAAEFTPIGGELARAFIAHKADMGMAERSDEWIVAHVDDVCAVLTTLTEHAVAIERPAMAAALRVVARASLCPEQRQARDAARWVMPRPRQCWFSDASTACSPISPPLSLDG